MNRKEAAKAVGVSPRTILRAIQSRQLDAVKFGEGKTCSYMISRSAIAEYIQRRGESNDGQKYSVP
ncbi:Helix-turn-helix domain protein [compost metagenome]